MNAHQWLTERIADVVRWLESDEPTELEGLPGDGAFADLARAFRLTSFEQAVVMLCIAYETDARAADACRAVSKVGPTLSLALSRHSAAHWSALAPGGALRYWRLVRLVPGDSITRAPIRIDERVLSYVLGFDHLDAELFAWVHPLIAEPAAGVRSRQDLCQRLIGRIGDHLRRPHVVLAGDPDEARGVCQTAALALGARAFEISEAGLPQGANELWDFIQYWEREWLLSRAVLFVSAEETAPTQSSLPRFLRRAHGPVVVSVPRMRSDLGFVSRLEVDSLPAAERLELWQHGLRERAADLNGVLEDVAAQFRFSSAAIADVCRQAHESCAEPLDGSRLRSLCRDAAQAQLHSLSQKITPAAEWDDLVLPPEHKSVLAQLVMQVRARHTVYEEWGFRKRLSSRGLGVTALFAGPSGTGKTLAAEVLAKSLGLDLYRIDLSQVVSKYIGETEKNLSRVFDTAESTGCVLLFDEADALFGKRTEVQDSHDRYANIEVSYLLQRMEAYEGLAILTTNMKEFVDAAFTRRLRFVLTFPFPRREEREEIWRRMFPPETPIEEVDPSRLATLNIPGGNIRNIALHAAFIAADAGEPVRMSHLMDAARAEYAKLERPLTDVEVAVWP